MSLVSPAGTLDGAALAEAQRLATLEHAFYLDSRTDATLRSGHPFDLTHQTLLRLAVLYEVWPGPDAHRIARYFLEPESRAVLRDQIRSLLPEPNVEDWDSEERMGYAGTPASLCDAFRRIIDPGNPRAFAHRYGFGVFMPTGERRPNGLVLVGTPNAASVGGLMFYGFSGGQHDEYYVQELSARILAGTMAVLATSMPPDIRSDWVVEGVRRELSGVGLRYEDLEVRADALTSACIEFLAMHERGHALDPVEAPRTAAMIGKHLDTLELARVLASPNDDQLDAWPRLQAGIDLRPSDVVFLYGDYLANLAGLERGLDQDGLAALRAYNWWFVPKTRPESSRPRGDLVFLALDGTDPVTEGLARIEAVLGEPPESWGARMRSLELWAWDEIRSRPRADDPIRL